MSAKSLVVPPLGGPLPQFPPKGGTTNARSRTLQVIPISCLGCLTRGPAASNNQASVVGLLETDGPKPPRAYPVIAHQTPHANGFPSTLNVMPESVVAPAEEPYHATSCDLPGRRPSVLSAGAGDTASALAADVSPTAAVAKIKQLGGKTTLDAAGRVVKVDLMDIEVTDADVQLVASLPDLQWLRLWGAALPTTARASEGACRLKTLGLLFTNITDNGLACVEDMTTLEALDLRGSARLGDPGLVRLKKLTRLTSLKLQTTGVTDAGLDNLRA